MSPSEFSNEFDVLYNNITSNQAPGLDAYEKSVLLTKAQIDIIFSYFNPKENKTMEGYDGSKKRQVDFSNLIETVSISPLLQTDSFDTRGLIFTLPSDFLIPINEIFYSKNKRYVVTPLSYKEYDRLMAKPFQFPDKYHVWRLYTPEMFHSGPITAIGSYNSRATLANTTPKKVILVFECLGGSAESPVVREEEDSIRISCNYEQSSTTQETLQHISEYIEAELGLLDSSDAPFRILEGITNPNNFQLPDTIDVGGTVRFEFPAGSLCRTVEIIGYGIGRGDYLLRYLRIPSPIILEELTDNLSIQGKQAVMGCELPKELHYDVLQRAVEFAKAIYTGDLQSQILLGQLSQTDIGTVTQTRQ